MSTRTTIFFLFLCSLMYARETLPFTTSYCVATTQELCINDLDDALFIALPNKQLTKGIETEQCWIKVEINNTAAGTQDYVVELRGLYSHLEAVGLRSNDDTTLLCNGDCDDHIIGTVRQSNSSVKLNLAKGTNSIYFKIAFKKEVMLSINVYSASEYTLRKAIAALDIGFYYGIVIMALLANLLCFFYFRDSIFIQYMVTLLIINLSIAYHDGVLQWLLPEGWITDNALILLLCALSYVGAYVFGSNYLQLKRYIPQSMIFARGIILSTFVIFGAFFISNNLIFYTLGLVSTFILLCYYLSLSFVLFKKQISARFFAIGYSLLFITASCYLFPILFSDLGHGLALKHVKLGGFIEMIVLFMGILSRFSALQKENEMMRTQIRDYMDEIRLSEVKELETKQQGSENIKSIVDSFNLSDREKEVLVELSQGQSNSAIAKRLFISTNTVKYHTSNIYTKLNVKNRAEAVSKYYSRTSK